jgi:hypothetical protein
LLDHVLPELPRPNRYVLPLGAVLDGPPLSEMSPKLLQAHSDEHGHLRLRLTHGLELRGRVLRVIEKGGRVQLALFAALTITRNGQLLLQTLEPYPWLLADRVLTAHACPPQGFYPATEFAHTQVPKARNVSAQQRDLLDLYERALSTVRECFGAGVVPRFEAIHRDLCERHPDEWLLRWNLLESLVKLGGQGPALGSQLSSELEQLELRYLQREPIATGLAYLRAIGLT